MAFTYLIVVLFILNVGTAIRILGIFPYAAQSHISCNLGVMRSLHAAGHHITIIRPFPVETGVANFTTIDSRSNNTFISIGQTTVEEYDKSLGDMMDFVLGLEMGHCHDIMNLPAVQEALKSTKKLYDVMFIELILSHKCFLPVAEKLNIPVIGVVTLHSWKFSDRYVGLPNYPAVIPSEVSRIMTLEMNFIERIVNLWHNLFIDYIWRRKMDKEMESFYREYFTEDLLYTKDISLIFYNNHDSLLPRPMPPNAINVGGIHLKPAKPLPKDLLKFIEEATHGVVLFSLGSVVKASTLSREHRNAYLEAFRSIPQRVIWKFEENIENLPQNIMLSNWIPQRDILEHRNVIAFMSHCGQSGVYEAVVTGTPVVTIPLFGDQYSNAGLLLHRKVGVFLDYKTVTKDRVLTALNTIINNTSFYQRMQELSLVFMDRPMTPQKSIVYWTEYVVRHNGAPLLRALGTDMPLYKYLMLDIIALASVIIIGALFVILTITRKFWAGFLKGSKLKHTSKAKKDE